MLHWLREEQALPPGGLLPFLVENSRLVVIRVFVSFNQWLWMLAVLGLGCHYLNRPGPVLTYINEAILLRYILHQTVIVLLAFWLATAGGSRPAAAAQLNHFCCAKIGIRTVLAESPAGRLQPKRSLRSTASAGPASEHAATSVSLQER
jgi:hypothetical protein